LLAVPLPGVEVGIAASAILLGAAVMMARVIDAVGDKGVEVAA